MGDPESLTAQEIAVTLGLTRDGLRKARRNKDRGRRRWGDQYDSSAMDRRIETLESIYVKLGGDPRRINERSLIASEL